MRTRGRTTSRPPSLADDTSAAPTGISGKWRIMEMDLWDREAIDLVGPASIEFKGGGGQFRFIAVEGWMDCRHGRRNGRPSVDFTWEGHDEDDSASGRGWVTLRKDGSLAGHIYFHQGDDSSFKGVPFEEDNQRTSRSSPKATRRRRW